ncbi:MAG: alpha-amylase family glycosyl hydrolase [Cytophagales bacterium]|nr:alpha-amylase family glycosyl hydrolase [Cytophagales bacterium]
MMHLVCRAGLAFLGNHDFPRMVSRWGNDKTIGRSRPNCCVRYFYPCGVYPFIYMGDEIGMTNTYLNAIANYYGY